MTIFRAYYTTWPYLGLFPYIDLIMLFVYGYTQMPMRPNIQAPELDTILFIHIQEASFTAFPPAGHLPGRSMPVELVDGEHKPIVADFPPV